MITSIGMLPSRKITKFREYKPLQEDVSVLDEYKLDILDTLSDANSARSFDLEDEITQNDKLIYATCFDDEFMGLAVFTSNYYNDNYTVKVHHNNSIISTIFDSCLLENDLIALATMDTADVLIHDVFVNQPLKPSMVLKYKSNNISTDNFFVSGVKYFNNHLYSTCYTNLIKWDLEKTTVINEENKNMEIERFNINENAVVVGKDLNILINNDIVYIENPLEQFTLSNNFVYVVDSEGFLTSFDLRNLENKKSKQITDNKAIFDVKVTDDKIIIISEDKSLRILDKDFNQLDKIELVSTPNVMCVDDDVLFVGLEDSFIQPYKFE
ncbi:hypothetical protein A0H76_2199 [Hepatospora eriocheir]|uniref:Uncharacterized protein n=1 Tax=Hepatospora eriocheir TaxID=1081669 RepID=A0A1X0QFS7_9MICR|nr:hypothetical protein A0H76_2199 [Hepatospora eriocheir]